MRRVPSALASLAALALTFPVAAAAGEVSGRVLLDGPPPAPVPGRASRDARAACGREIPDDSLLVSNGAVANVVVWLEREGLPAAPPDAGELTIRIESCRFRPRILAAAPGATLVVQNGDRTNHILLLSQNGAPLLHAALPIPGQSVRRRLTAPGPAELKCSAGHPWAHAVVQVPPTRWFAVTTADGAFSLRDVPDGAWTLVAWHETLGERRDPVEVRGDRIARDVTFLLP
jgi:hypothetical protein